MKRFGMLVATMLLMATVGFAQEAKKSGEVSFEKLSKYLNLNVEQYEEVSRINDYFVNQLGQPLSGEALCHNAKPQEEIDKALLCNLKLMKKALSKEQYGKYVALINATRANMESKVSNPMLDSYLAEK
ncbi:MAG: hypothetical protein SO169_08020 [Parabacteroides sp.]|nr:hypothetical protein [Parabacteroides sp.]